MDEEKNICIFELSTVDSLQKYKTGLIVSALCLFPGAISGTKAMEMMMVVEVVFVAMSSCRCQFIFFDLKSAGISLGQNVLIYFY